MGASRAIVLPLTFVLWKIGLFMAAMAAGENNCQASVVSTSVQGAIQEVEPACEPVPAEDGQLRAVAGVAPPGQVRQRRHRHRHLPHLPRGRRLLQPTPCLRQDQADEGITMPNLILPDIHEVLCERKEKIHGGDPDGGERLCATANPCGQMSSLLGWSVLLSVVGPGSGHVGPILCLLHMCWKACNHSTCPPYQPVVAAFGACDSLQCGIQLRVPHAASHGSYERSKGVTRASLRGCISGELEGMQQQYVDSAAPSPLWLKFQRVGFIFYRSFFVASIVFGYVKFGRLPWDFINFFYALMLRFCSIVDHQR